MNTTNFELAIKKFIAFSDNEEKKKELIQEIIDVIGIFGKTEETINCHRENLRKHLEFVWRLPKYLKMLFLRLNYYGKNFLNVNIKDMLKCYNPDNIRFSSNINLIKENGNIYALIGTEKFCIIACHVSSGSENINGYRYMNFICENNLVFYCDSIIDPLYLIGQIYILFNY